MIDRCCKRSNVLALALLAFGLSAMAGEVLKISALKGIGLASCAAPYTKVFSEATTSDGSETFETFAAKFILHYETSDGDERSIHITPELYQKLKGPYQRRNVYGAILAYGPALSKDVQQRTFDYAVDSPGALRKELSIPENATNLSVEMISQTAGSKQIWTLQGTSNHPQF